jgi:[ribosomal protein S5]-alanine N-acetyltransferase
MANDRAHWRARTPATYYCTHSLAPVAAITGTRPVQVSGFVVPTAAGPEALERACRGRGWAAALVVRLDNGAVFKSLHGFLEAGQQAWVRLHGDRGLMENLRQGDTRTLRMVWDVEDGEGGRRAEEVYLPWPPQFRPPMPIRWATGWPRRSCCATSPAPSATRGHPTRTCTSASSCRSPAFRRCAPAWPEACLLRSPTCAAPTSVEPARLMTGIPSCQNSSERSQRSRPSFALAVQPRDDDLLPDEPVRLRPIEEADLDLLSRFDTDAAASQPFEWTGFRDPGTRRRRWEEDGWIGRDSAHLAVGLPDGTLAGLVSWRTIKAGGPDGGCLEIGALLFPEHRGRGLGTAAQDLLVEYLFATTLANRLQAITDVENLAEQRVLERIGFRREGALRGLAFIGGRWRDGVLYARLRDDR